MKGFAKENNKQVNYLIELGFRKLLSNNEINLSELSNQTTEFNTNPHMINNY